MNSSATHDRDADGVSATPVCVKDWGATFSGAPDLCSTDSGWHAALLRRWRGTSPEMEQPQLNRHYLVLHLKGAKRITRSRGGPTLVVDAKPESVTSVPAGASHDWSTAGPIGFAHLYLDPVAVGRTVQERFDLDPRSVELTDEVGCETPMLAALFAAMLAQIETPGFSARLVLDSLLQSFLIALICERSTIGAVTRVAPHSLAPRRLRRVLDFIEANLADDLELDDLATVAGSSRFHFARAFRDATGFPPYRYLVHRRVDAAKTLLLGDDLTIEQIAAQCGFKSGAQFAVMFKQMFGTTPSRFRREH